MSLRKGRALHRLNLRLSQSDLDRADSIAIEFARRTGQPPSRAAALRWGLRELEARLALEDAGHEDLSLVPLGPVAPPGDPADPGGRG